tara:strand:- start:7767 stop:8390 length:624 start_codon:yes stop_codon:yes gene_type:complete
MSLTQHLVIFAKAPRLGTVKSRLAADVGEVEARRIYRQMTDRTIRPLTRDTRWQTYLAVTPDRHALSGFGWSLPKLARLPQGGGDLGDRLGHIHRDLAPGPVVFIGTDLPDINSERVARAFKALGDHDAVLGPASDGGYWLIGFKRRPRILDVFNNIRWSSAHTMKDTIGNIEADKKYNSRIKLLEQLDDIDDIASYQKFQKRYLGR